MLISSTIRLQLKIFHPLNRVAVFTVRQSVLSVRLRDFFDRMLNAELWPKPSR